MCFTPLYSPTLHTLGRSAPSERQIHVRQLSCCCDGPLEMVLVWLPAFTLGKRLFLDQIGKRSSNEFNASYLKVFFFGSVLSNWFLSPLCTPGFIPLRPPLRCGREG